MKFGSISTIPIAILLHLAIEFTYPQLRRRVRTWLLFIGYSTATLFFMVYLFTDLLWTKPILMEWGWTQSYVIEGLANILLSIWVPLIAISALSLIWRSSKNNQNWCQKQQARYLFVGILIPFLGSSISDLILPFFISSFPMLFNIAYIAAGAVIASAILKYGLFVLRPTEIAEQLLSRISEPVLLVDPNEKIEALNAAFANLTGYEKSLLLGQSIQKLFRTGIEGNIGQEQAEINSILNPTVIQNLEMKLRTNSGNSLPVMISKSPIEDRDRHLQGFIYFITDLASRQEAEINTQVHKVLRVADNINAELLTWASHEIKTPLVAILGWSELLYKAKKAGKDLNRVFDEGDLQAMWRSATRLEDIVKNFLDAGLIQKHGLKLTLNSTDILDLLKESLNVVEASAVEKNINIKLPTTCIQAEVDRSKIRQSLINLFSNAIKYSPPNSAVEVFLVHKSKKEMQGFELQIIDHGYGFTSEELEHIFEPFVRIYTQQEEKKYTPGVGLGLYITKTIIVLHGGEISLISEGQGKGTTIRIWLPEKNQDLVTLDNIDLKK